jgi:predicted secreted protein
MSLNFEFEYSLAGIKPWAIAVCGVAWGRDCASPCMARSEVIDEEAKCAMCVVARAGAEAPRAVIGFKPRR